MVIALVHTGTEKELLSLFTSFYRSCEIWDMALCYKQLLLLYPHSIVELNKKKRQCDSVIWAKMHATLIIMDTEI